MSRARRGRPVVAEALSAEYLEAMGRAVRAASRFYSESYLLRYVTEVYHAEQARLREVTS